MPPALLISVETCQVPNWIRTVANVVKCGRGLLSPIGHDGHLDWVFRLRRPFVLPLWMCGRSMLKCLLQFLVRPARHFLCTEHAWSDWHGFAHLHSIRGHDEYVLLPQHLEPQSLRFGLQSHKETGPFRLSATLRSRAHPCPSV